MNQNQSSNKQPSIAQFEEQLQLLKSKPRTKQTKSEIEHLKNHLHKHYTSNKNYIMEFEKTNYNYLALVRSTHNYYKIFGHSALFYTYSLAPKLNLNANLQDDKDYTSKSDTGFVSIRDISKLTTLLATLDIKRVKTKNQTGDFVLFKFPWAFTETQINDFNEQNLIQLQQFNHIVIVDNVIPVLFITAEELLKTIYENVRGMGNPVAREALGYKIITSATTIIYLYLDLANGHIDKLKCLKAIKSELKTIKYQIKILTDLRIWTPKICSRLGESIIKMQDIIERELKHI
ncbi:hypothetical protein IJI28_01410 [Candidatus Saccharibacteria bacterium]|nr:hypothetical protein [Candidatus Saccharibacteria bacterium]